MQSTVIVAKNNEIKLFLGGPSKRFSESLSRNQAKGSMQSLDDMVSCGPYMTMD